MYLGACHTPNQEEAKRVAEEILPQRATETQEAKNPWPRPYDSLAFYVEESAPIVYGVWLDTLSQYPFIPKHPTLDSILFLDGPKVYRWRVRPLEPSWPRELVVVVWLLLDKLELCTT